MPPSPPGPPDLVAIPGGAFRMGRDDRRPDERPPHEVRLAPFRAARTPVSNAEYAQFVAATGAEPPPFVADPAFAGPAQPVVGVSWFDAAAYCAWLGALTGLPLRLPAEAEREFAALGGRAGTDWPWGDDDPAARPELAFIREASAPHVPQEACANGYGLCCMAENVHEWCLEPYQRRYPTQCNGGPASLTTPTAPARPSLPDPGGVDPEQRRVSRGGSWRHRIKFTRVSARSSLRPGARYNDYGFRVYAFDA